MSQLTEELKQRVPAETVGLGSVRCLRIRGDASADESALLDRALYRALLALLHRRARVGTRHVCARA